ncbi:phosphatidylinositol phosphatase PTPRQ-like isoform X1 [Diadema antillarum]|uniref:phosphatidylinositol phosphatase PTPRQ-like isoform X1 n=2 Tax=Diadema antillarum TaxID=105358 RepID=UPI003A8647E0
MADGKAAAGMEILSSNRIRAMEAIVYILAIFLSVQSLGATTEGGRTQNGQGSLDSASPTPVVQTSRESGTLFVTDALKQNTTTLQNSLLTVLSTVNSHREISTLHSVGERTESSTTFSVSNPKTPSNDSIQRTTAQGVRSTLTTSNSNDVNTSTGYPDVSTTPAGSRFSPTSSHGNGEHTSVFEITSQFSKASENMTVLTTTELVAPSTPTPSPTSSVTSTAPPKVSASVATAVSDSMLPANSTERSSTGASSSFSSVHNVSFTQSMEPQNASVHPTPANVSTMPSAESIGPEDPTTPALSTRQITLNTGSPSNRAPFNVTSTEGSETVVTVTSLVTDFTTEPMLLTEVQKTEIISELATDTSEYLTTPSLLQNATVTPSTTIRPEPSSSMITEAITDLVTESASEVSVETPEELLTVETSTEVVTYLDTTDDGLKDVTDSIRDSTTPIATTPVSATPAPELCDFEVAPTSVHVCLCNSSLAASNYTYRVELVRCLHGNSTGPDVPVHTDRQEPRPGCWNISVPLGASYRLVVTAFDGFGGNASTPTSYFYTSLQPPYLSVTKRATPDPTLDLIWDFQQEAFVDYVTIYIQVDDEEYMQKLTWLSVGRNTIQGMFSYFSTKFGAKHTFEVQIHSGNESVFSNKASYILAPLIPEKADVTNVTERNITLQLAPLECKTCSYLVRYKPTGVRDPVVDTQQLPVECQATPGTRHQRSDCYTVITALVPGTSYDIQVFTVSYKKSSSGSFGVQRRTLPASPLNVTVTNVTRETITLSWSHGEGYRTHYALRAWAEHSEEVGKVHGDVTHFTFHNLLAGASYFVSITARVNDIHGVYVIVTDRTLPTEPGPVDRLLLELLQEPQQIRLGFLAPMRPNGVLRGYRVKYSGNRTGESRICSKDQRYLPVSQTSVIIEQLKGGCNYTFIVQAQNEVGYGPERSGVILTKIGIPEIPEVVPSHPASKSIRSTGFDVTFDPSIFSDDNGPITHVSVIVAEAAAANEPESGNSTHPKMTTWAEAISEDVIPPYQISDPIDISEMQSGRRRRRSVATTLSIEIGGERCSKNEKDVYCNGPLAHGRSYVYRFRGMSPGGYADTPFSLPVPLPTSPHTVIIGISTALFSLLVVVIILSIIVIVRKFRLHKCLRVVLQCKHRLDGRGRYHAANLKDVELTRVANNHHQSTVVSKQKYSRPVRLSEFTRDWYSMNADSNYGYSQEYEAIRKVGKKLTTSTAVSAANVGKNRYTNILPYDRTRVKLSSVDDEDGSDYINANYIPGFTSPREYIAFQGPLPGTADDTWRMIWEQNVSTVVMVTQLVEKGKVKCDQYWPDDHKPVLYGDIQVTMTQTFEETNWNIKEFILQIRDQRRHVRHWNFLSWPDHGVPDSSQDLLSFIRRIRSTVTPPSTTPIAVHCSAGVGRTGTFIVLDRLLQHIEQYDYVDIMGIVCEMRMHRNFMVQTEQQYVFIHRCLLDVLEEKGLAPMPLMGGSLP